MRALTTALFSLLILTAGIAQPRKFIISGVPFYPFHYMNGEKADGIFVEFIDRIFTSMNQPYEIRITDVAGFNDVKAGKIDAVMSVGYAQDRESFMIFPEGFSDAGSPKNYVWISNYHFFVKKENEAKFSFTKLSELRAKDPVVGVMKGISYHPDFWGQKFRVKEMNSNEENFKALQRGEIDLFLIDKTVGAALVKRDNLKTGISVLPTVIFSRHYTLVLSKSSDFPNKEAVFRQFFEGYNKLKVTAEARAIFTEYMN